MKHLLLLGGGPAHVQVLRSLARSGLAAAHVTMIAPFLRPASDAMLAGFVAGHHGFGAGSASLPDLTHAANVQFVQAQPMGLNAMERTATLADGRVIGYDVLSIDTGPVMNRDLIPGARSYALFARPVEHFTRLWGGLLILAAERALSVVVLGGGTTAVELAMALQFRLANQARVSLVTGGGVLLPGKTEPVRQRCRQALKRLGVTLIEEVCTEITGTHAVLRGGGRLVCDAPIAAWDSDSPAWLSDSGLALDTQGFVLTGATLQSSSHPAVFAVGEVASRVDLAADCQQGSAQVAKTLATNLRRFISMGALVSHAPLSSPLRFLDCADRRAIASWGDLAVNGRWVWNLKNWLDHRQVARQRA